MFCINEFNNDIIFFLKLRVGKGRLYRFKKLCHPFATNAK